MTTFTIIYTNVNGTTAYNRKTERGAKNLAARLMEQDNARSVQIERTLWEPEGTTTDIIYTTAQ